MKKLFLLSILALGLIVSATGQTTLDLTFTAVDSAAYVQLDSIRVMNRTQGGDTMIFWPDTALSYEVYEGDLLLYVGYATFSTVGVSEVNDDVSSFTVHQNYPNPMADRSRIPMYIPHAGEVHIMVTDLQGRAVIRTGLQLDGGHHSFSFRPGGGSLYFLTAHWNGMSRSIQMISTGQRDGRSCRLEYLGTQSGQAVLKNAVQVNDFIVRQSGITDSPEENTTYTFQFATNIPCLGMPTVEYEGQVYNTIQVFSQCWLKENLNVGTMIQGNEAMTDNGITEKYCYNDQPDSCDKYGGLYQWDEMMQYATQQGAQGICPPGWHLPTDEEWQVLEGAVDSQYGIGDSAWLDSGYRGTDAGTNQKTNSGWYANGSGTDLFGFSGLPGGRHFHDGTFGNVVFTGFWWTSAEVNNNFAWYRSLYYENPEANRNSTMKVGGLSVRCLRD
jgi:uncharacterized protein (TIGR02145 family)